MFFRQWIKIGYFPMNETQRAWTARMRREGDPERLIILYRIFGYQTKLAFFVTDLVIKIYNLWVETKFFFRTGKTYRRFMAQFSQLIAVGKKR